MRYLFLLLITISLTVSCGQTPTPKITYGGHRVSRALPVQYPIQINSIQSLDSQVGNLETADYQDTDGDEIAMHAIINSFSRFPYAFIPLPKNWKIYREEASGRIITRGPNELVIRSVGSGDFYFPNDAELKKLYRHSNISVMKPMSMDSLFSEIIIPQAKEIGMHITDHYPLPDVASNNRAYLRQLSGSTPEDIHKVEGSDWVDSNGNKAFIILHYFEKKTAGITSWRYNLEMLEAAPEYFEKARKQFVYGISNKRFNKSEIVAYNDRIAGEKWLGDYRRFNGDFHKDSTGKLVRDEPRFNYLDYQKIEADFAVRYGKDRAPEEIRNDSVNVNLKVNPFDGKDYLIGSGYPIYWITGSCRYIPTCDSLYDPNTYEDHAGVWKKCNEINTSHFPLPVWRGKPADK